MLAFETNRWQCADMLTTLVVAALLNQQVPAPLSSLGARPGLGFEAPGWAFEAMPIPGEPTFPFAAAWADFLEEERAQALMFEVTPFVDPGSITLTEAGRAAAGAAKGARPEVDPFEATKGFWWPTPEKTEHAKRW